MYIDQEKIDRIKREREMTQVKSSVNVVEEQCAILAYEVMMMSVKSDSSTVTFSGGSMWFTLISSFYKNELWNKNMVKEAVEFGKLTEVEYEEITGEKYTV